MNRLGSKGEPFVFLVDFLMENPMLFPIDCPKEELQWEIPKSSHVQVTTTNPQLKHWKTFPVSFSKYKKGFDVVERHIYNGDTYLLNYTQPTPVETNLSLDEIFKMSNAPYKILLKNRFVCFSPETFVKIENGQISSFPMKGTIDADDANAKELILADSKELAEHNTIVDLIRNDLSIVAENVEVKKFRYFDRIHTNNKDLWQVSSQITGDLPKNYQQKIGDILFALLPAGSISGAPKKKTIEIIRETENYNRGFYTGVFGVFDGKNMDSCVLIRFIENQNGQLVYKSGGGITFLSQAESEYEEIKEKVYVPIG
ncbi:aminodeoxychorismate synthase, subunit I [Mariniphaga anaerophila]|uniref:Aminodeoxychorismate synthase, subunit I n=2 Tax=Mariniphaga anaerophila TaxID=1484053 RepID=A0A1M4ZVU7_9BACT|nr:aminodeoxychorismate synthase, subunit I [Mariniphaga anaerophila]